MENFTAAFRSDHDLQQAVDALRKQGVIDLQIEPGVEPHQPMPTSLLGGGLSHLSTAESPGCLLQIVVESSRIRQAEDTVTRFGGQLDR
ncbi:hypothetical protein [Paenibacillus ehimensis]|uniref:DUF2007 domain-containing protein n=1 Tax=Paenibacillus ehimensis TaxID=79264 RepID=A0ABT8VJM0_9BACL|nr:hypothetical protein [Paenibacillus ehimensis]MDO3681187.1 hypothetical protein [Paenibacillus ehimensis]MEC0208219.1 hypothetical protein [Paenibacillus ehimensis]